MIHKEIKINIGDRFWYTLISATGYSNYSFSWQQEPIYVEIEEITVDSSGYIRYKIKKVIEDSKKFYGRCIKDSLVRKYFYLTEEEAISHWNSVILNEVDRLNSDKDKAILKFDKQESRLRKKLL